MPSLFSAPLRPCPGASASSYGLWVMGSLDSLLRSPLETTPISPQCSNSESKSEFLSPSRCTQTNSARFVCIYVLFKFSERGVQGFRKDDADLSTRVAGTASVGSGKSRNGRIWLDVIGVLGVHLFIIQNQPKAPTRPPLGTAHVRTRTRTLQTVVVDWLAGWLTGSEAPPFVRGLRAEMESLQQYIN
jgi:hypothetical protein